MWIKKFTYYNKLTTSTIIQVIMVVDGVSVSACHYVGNALKTIIQFSKVMPCLEFISLSISLSAKKAS